VAIEDAGVEALETGHRGAVVPLVRDGREQLRERIQEQRLAETKGAGQEIMGTFRDQSQRKAGLVHLVEIALPDLAEGLDAEREQGDIFRMRHQHRRTEDLPRCKRVKGA